MENKKESRNRPCNGHIIDEKIPLQNNGGKYSHFNVFNNLGKDRDFLNRPQNLYPKKNRHM